MSNHQVGTAKCFCHNSSIHILEDKLKLGEKMQEVIQDVRQMNCQVIDLVISKDLVDQVTTFIDK